MGWSLAERSGGACAANQPLPSRRSLQVSTTSSDQNLPTRGSASRLMVPASRRTVAPTGLKANFAANPGLRSLVRTCPPPQRRRPVAGDPGPGLNSHGPYGAGDAALRSCLEENCGCVVGNSERFVVSHVSNARHGAAIFFGWSDTGHPLLDSRKRTCRLDCVRFSDASIPMRLLYICHEP